jgi:hypothetical protein
LATLVAYSIFDDIQEKFRRRTVEDEAGIDAEVVGAH